MRWARPSAALAAGLALTLGAATAAASPEDVFGFGPRSMARGAPGAAAGQGFETVWSNPALLSLARERELTLGLMGAAFDLRAGGEVPYEALKGSLIGAVLPIPFGGVLRDRVAIGLGFFTPFDLVVRGRILYPEKPQFLLADRTQSVAVQAGIGIDASHGIRLGAGFAALAALSGQVLVATDASGRIGTVVDDTLVASYGPIFGASFDLGDAYRVGAAFRGELVGRFNVVINVKDLGQIVVPPLNISGIAQYDPWQIALEVARVKGPLKVSLGATYKHWSAYPGPPEATVRCPQIDPETGKPGEVECAALVPTDPGFSDTVVARFGVEWTLTPARPVTMRLRGGYFFEPSPAPVQTRESSYYDSHRSAFTLGYGLELDDPLPPVTIDLFAQVHVLHLRTHEKDADVIAAGYAGPASVESRGIILAGGTTAGVKF